MSQQLRLAGLMFIYILNAMQQLKTRENNILHYMLL